MSKKIAFLTIHVGENFGSNLQTIATAEVIKKTGNEPILINYCPRRVARKHYWLDAIYKPLKLLWRILYAPIHYKNLHIYEGFLEKNCVLTAPIYDEDDFVARCPQADVYITGSDQVWNSVHNGELNKRYYFDGMDARKVAFASSFGIETLPEDEYNEVKHMLASYSAISVRESSAKDIVNRMGYNATHLLDPTLMLDSFEWDKYASARIIPDSYLLVYVPYNIADKQKLYASARQVANAKHLKVVTFSWGMCSEKLADRTIKFASPGDFLSLMKYAEFIITNSFHGTAFSINLNKQFLVYMPSAFSTRISSILSMCQLEDRLMTGDEVILPYNKIIDYESTNTILELERLKSLEFLKNALQ